MGDHSRKVPEQDGTLGPEMEGGRCWDDHRLAVSVDERGDILGY